MPSLQKRVRAVPPEQRMAAIAAVVLVLSMALPWYQKSYVPEGKSAFVTDSLSAFGVFTFVEAAILLVAAGVLFLIWARMEGKGFHLPGRRRVRDHAGGRLGGGAADLARVRPARRRGSRASRSASSGASSSRWWPRRRWSSPARACAPRTGPEPPNPAEDLDWESAAPRPRRRASDREPRDATAVTEVLRDRPNWDGDAPDAPDPRRRRRDPDAPIPTHPPTASSERRNSGGCRARLSGMRLALAAALLLIAPASAQAAWTGQELSGPHTFVDDPAVVVSPSGRALAYWDFQDGLGNRAPLRLGGRHARARRGRLRDGRRGSCPPRASGGRARSSTRS